VIGGVPVHVPVLAVRVSPSLGVPEMLGGAVLTGIAWLAAEPEPTTATAAAATSTSTSDPPTNDLCFDMPFPLRNALASRPKIGRSSDIHLAPLEIVRKS
jgi:hypothetical protein